MVLVSKLTFFPCFFFWQNRPGKGVRRHSPKEKASPDYKQRVKKPKNWDFFKGVSSWFGHCCLKN